MKRYGSLSYVPECASGVELEAQRAFEEAFGAVRDSEHLAFLRGMVPYVLSRQ